MNKKELIKNLKEMGFIEDVKNGLIWEYKHHYIRVYLDLFYNSYWGLNVRASKYAIGYKDFKDFEKGLIFIKKLKNRLLKDLGV